jgi:ribosomal protein S18 acetylase RimI-like enzyme
VSGRRRYDVRALAPEDRPWLREHLELAWGDRVVVSRGRRHDASLLDGYVAVADDELVGLATFLIAGGSCQLVTIEAFRSGEGVGSCLLDAVASNARRQGCARLWLVTTNDNLDALRFYQRRGLRLVAVHRGAVDDARAIKPAIPLVGEHGIEIHDELELELALA